MSYEELGYAESFIEAKMLVESIIRGNEDVPPYQDTLRENGFEIKYPDRSQNNYFLKIGSGHLCFDVRPDYNAHVTYHGFGDHWHNVARLDMKSRDYKDTIDMWNFFPPQATNAIDILAQHMIAVMKARLEREKTRFSTPLGGNLPKWR